MAMTRQTYSLSGLSVELGRDRRTLAKLLDDLPPEETKEGNRGRIEKRWHLSAVLEHLKRKDKAHRAPTEFEYDPELKAFTFEVLIPALSVLDEFHSHFPALLVYDFGLTKEQALDVMVHAINFVILGARTFFEDPEMVADIPAISHYASWVRFMEPADPEAKKAFIAKHWPDKPSKKRSTRAKESR